MQNLPKSVVFAEFRNRAFFFFEDPFRIGWFVLLFVLESVWLRRGCHGVVRSTTHDFVFVKPASLYVVLVINLVSRVPK